MSQSNFSAESGAEKVLGDLSFAPADKESTTRDSRSAILLGSIAAITLAFHRSGFEPTSLVLIEVASLTILSWLAATALRTTALRSNFAFRSGSTLLLTFLPGMIEIVRRQFGSGADFEIVMLNCLAWGAIALAVFSTDQKSRSLSVVASGFLTLFTTCTSDDQRTLLFAILWTVICLWWLTAKHWEQVMSCPAVRVERVQGHLISSVLAGVAVFGLCIWLTAGQMRVFFNLDAGLMPTSGGSKWSDAFAEKGVGSGEMLIAARDHASSFGAVETDLFLDSEQPSLFDMFSDEFGEPRKKKTTISRAKALSPQNSQQPEQRFAESNRSGKSFTIDREPARRKQEVHDLDSDAIMFWSGRQPLRLACQRFTQFDGWTWTNSNVNESQRLTSTQIDGRTWIERQSTASKTSELFVGAIPEALQFTRYRAAEVPVPAGYGMWSIDEIDDATFFAVNSHGCLKMPGQEYIPDYTMIRLVNRNADLQQIERRLQQLASQTQRKPRSLDTGIDGPDLATETKRPAAQRGVDPAVDRVGAQVTSTAKAQVWKAEARRLARQYAADHPFGWQQVQAVLSGIRSDFRLDKRNSSKEIADSPLMHFFEHRAGDAHLFATAACLMLNELGYETRFAAGFFVPAKTWLSRVQNTPINTRDVHVWPELHVGNGEWIPLEPTPGFDQPKFAVSWSYRLGQLLPVLLQIVAIAALLGVLLWLARVRLFEASARWLWMILARTGDRTKVAWLLFILDQRFRLAGMPRPASSLPRAWYGGMFDVQGGFQSDNLQVLLCEADALWFGGARSLSESGRQACRQLWLHLTADAVKRMSAESRIDRGTSATIRMSSQQCS